MTCFTFGLSICIKEGIKKLQDRYQRRVAFEFVAWVLSSTEIVDFSTQARASLRGARRMQD